jgi:hypothetical protein
LHWNGLDQGFELHEVWTREVREISDRL